MPKGHTNGVKFSAKYQPIHKRGMGRTTIFNNWMRIKMQAGQLSHVDQEILDYCESFVDNPTVFDITLANMILMSWSTDPKVAFPAAKEILERFLGKAGSLDSDDGVIEMEQVVDVDMSLLDGEKIKQIEDVMKEAKILNEQNDG